MTTTDKLHEVVPSDSDIFTDLDNMLSDFDDMYVVGGTDPATEYDDCAGGACKL